MAWPVSGSIEWPYRTYFLCVPMPNPTTIGTPPPLLTAASEIHHRDSTMFTDTRSEVQFERGPNGRHLAVSRDIDADPDAVWTILTDTTYWPAWGPSVTGVDCADQVIQAGSRGRIDTAFGMPLPFEITSCSGFRWTWKVSNISATGHRVEALDTGSRVVFELPVLAAAYAPVCQRALREIERLAEDL